MVILRGPALTLLLLVIVWIAASDYRDWLGVVFVVFMAMAIAVGSQSDGLEAE
jgi:hypothetical protein